MFQGTSHRLVVNMWTALWTALWTCAVDTVFFRNPTHTEEVLVEHRIGWIWDGYGMDMGWMLTSSPLYIVYGFIPFLG